MIIFDPEFKKSALNFDDYHGDRSKKLQLTEDDMSRICMLAEMIAEDYHLSESSWQDVAMYRFIKMVYAAGYNHAAGRIKDRILPELEVIASGI